MTMKSFIRSQIVLHKKHWAQMVLRTSSETWKEEKLLDPFYEFILTSLPKLKKDSERKKKKKKISLIYKPDAAILSKIPENCRSLCTL